MRNKILILSMLFYCGPGLLAENSHPGLGSDPERWTPGEKVTTWEQLAKYTGRRALGQIVRKRAYRLNYDQLEINYGENVEFQLRRRQAMREQADSVKADVSDRWTWEFRLRQCEVRYFNPNEVNGFENYSLTDADQYGYQQLTEQQVRERGLYKINEKYRATIDGVFGTSDAARQGLKRRQDSDKR